MVTAVNAIPAKNCEIISGLNARYLLRQHPGVVILEDIMKKRFTRLAVLLFFLLGAGELRSQLSNIQNSNYLNTYETNKFYWGVTWQEYGSIRSINQTKYRLSIQEGKYMKGERISNLDNRSNIRMQFDEFGNLIGKDQDYMGTRSETYSYRYDAYGNLLEIKTHDKSGDWRRSEIYTYDEFGQLLQEEIVSSDTYMKYYYNYNEYGEIVDTFYTEWHGYSLVEFFMEVWVLEEPVHQKDVYLRIVSSYDANGNLVEENTHYSNEDNVLGGIIETYSLEYDENGNLLREFKKDLTQGSGKYYMELVYMYDDKGLLTGTRFTHKIIDLTINTEIFRDERGRVAEIIENQKVLFNTVKHSEKFEYDAHGNVHRIYFFKNDKPKFMIERVIEYYPEPQWNTMHYDFPGNQDIFSLQ